MTQRIRLQGEPWNTNCCLQGMAVTVDFAEDGSVSGVSFSGEDVSRAKIIKVRMSRLLTAMRVGAKP